MDVKLLKVKGTWRDIADACNTTIGKEGNEKEPTDDWKRKILKCEHSPIRKMIFNIKMIDIPYYISVHLVRHKIGIEHFVKTQRTDRTGVERSELPQGALVNHEIDINLQSLITISRKRLCNKADSKTTELWKMVVNCIFEHDSIISDALVPECIYRGFCPEFKSCGFIKSERFIHDLYDYRK